MKSETARPRQRRCRDELVTLIRHASRELFAARGYAATTTKEIARVANVSEALIFRYFGDKSRLFDDVVTEPFNQLMAKFVSEHGSSEGGEVNDLYARVYDLFDQNRDLLGAVFSGRPGKTDDSQTSDGLEPFFIEALARQRADNGEDTELDFDLDIAVRLSFGLMASAVLLRG